MAQTENDREPEGYLYAWSKKSSASLDEFLEKYKPSMVQNDGTKPWIWVHGEESSNSQTDEEKEAAAIAEASEYLGEITEEIEKIKNDNSIPIRSNKKTGAKSKKELREAKHAEATERLKEISIKHGYTCGKWLIFAPADRIDALWSSIATSLVSGPLRETAAFLTKVATSPQVEVEKHQHLICVYIPDVYDQAEVTKVMKVLLGNHGVNLSGVKSDLYTSIGIDSKHPSGIPSTVWKNTALMKEAEIKALKEEYFANLGKKPAAPQDTQPTAETQNTAEVLPKGKPKLQKKRKNNDPFASDDEDATSGKKQKTE